MTSQRQGEGPARGGDDGSPPRSARRIVIRAVCWGMFLFNAARIGAYVLFQEHTREGLEDHLVVLALVAAWGWLLIRLDDPRGRAGGRAG